MLSHPTKDLLASSPASTTKWEGSPKNPETEFSTTGFCPNEHRSGKPKHARRPLLPAVALAHVALSSCAFLSHWKVAHGLIMPHKNAAFVASRLANRSNYVTAGAAKYEGELEPTAVRVGFIGCGTISAAIARGLLSQKSVGIESVAVTHRSEAKSSELAAEYDRVTIYHDNQEVLDNSDLVFLGVLPEQAFEVLSGLTFDTKRHTLISLVSMSNLADLIEASSLPPRRMMCLPSVSKLQGVSLVAPQGHKLLKRLCDSLGGCVECEDEQKMKIMTTATSLMGPMYGIMKRNCQFLVERGIPLKDANYFIARTYLGIIDDAVAKCGGDQYLDELIAEQTRGGLNEQALKHLDQHGVLDEYDAAMSAVLDRLQQ